MSKTPRVIIFHYYETFRTTFAQVLRREGTSEWDFGAGAECWDFGVRRL